MDFGEMKQEKAAASAWFRALRDEIVQAFENLEDTQAVGSFSGLPAGRFEVTQTTRTGESISQPCMARWARAHRPR
jgi:coproporphyrinogen III oxidase